MSLLKVCAPDAMLSLEELARATNADAESLRFALKERLKDVLPPYSWLTVRKPNPLRSRCDADAFPKRREFPFFVKEEFISEPRFKVADVRRWLKSGGKRKLAEVLTQTPEYAEV